MKKISINSLIKYKTEKKMTSSNVKCLWSISHTLKGKDFIHMAHLFLYDHIHVYVSNDIKLFLLVILSSLQKMNINIFFYLTNT